jgi:hypothetical protein
MVSLPDSLPTATGSLTGVPSTTNPGQILTTVVGTGFAPFASVNFGIYSTPLLLATVTADASGTATATITIPASFLGAHTVTAAGSSPTNAALYLEAGTTVVKKVTPAANGGSDGGSGVGGVSTSASAPGGAGGSGASPNSGSTGALADTGPRVNPIALLQIALLALLAGAGLLMVTRRRKAQHRL